MERDQLGSLGLMTDSMLSTNPSNPNSNASSRSNSPLMMMTASSSTLSPVPLLLDLTATTAAIPPSETCFAGEDSSITASTVSSQQQCHQHGSFLQQRGLPLQSQHSLLKQQQQRQQHQQQEQHKQQQRLHPSYQQWMSQRQPCIPHEHMQINENTITTANNNYYFHNDGGVEDKQDGAVKVLRELRAVSPQSEGSYSRILNTTNNGRWPATLSNTINHDANHDANHDSNHDAIHDAIHDGVAVTTHETIQHPSHLDVFLDCSNNTGGTTACFNNRNNNDGRPIWHNAAFDQLLAQYTESFAKATLSGQANIVQLIASCVHENNGRFLERHATTGDWIELQGQSILLGISRALFQQVQLQQKAPLITSNLTNRHHHSNAESSSSVVDATLPPFHDPFSSSASQTHSNQCSLRNLYTAPTWSSETMPYETASGIHATNSTETMLSSINQSNATLPTMPTWAHEASNLLSQSSSDLAATRLVTNAPISDYNKTKLVVKKKNNQVKKSVASHASVKKPSTTVHNPDGTFAHKRRSLLPADVGVAVCPVLNNKPMMTTASTLLLNPEDAAKFNPRTWFAKFGTPESMSARAREIVPILSVEVIPRGVTMRPSGR